MCHFVFPLKKLPFLKIFEGIVFYLLFLILENKNNYQKTFLGFTSLVSFIGFCRNVRNEFLFIIKYKIAIVLFLVSLK